jgi:NADH:ubiquinone oxidoreductase subunit
LKRKANKKESTGSDREDGISAPLPQPLFWRLYENRCAFSRGSRILKPQDSGSSRKFMAKISIFGALTNIQILVHTLFRGKRVGQDVFGNIYYRGRPRFTGGRERRWVIYKDRPDASTVPAEWHGWLHHQTGAVPEGHSKYRKPWQKPFLPNMTGTDGAYLPPGHVKKGGQRPAATGDYTAWQPPQ